jgi:ferredoxin
LKRRKEVTAENEAYSELAETWRLKGSQSFINLAELWVTPEEAKVLSRLNWWMTSGELAKKLKMDEEQVKTTLGKVARTGLVRQKDGYWNASANMGSPFPQMAPAGVPEEKFNERWIDFFRSGDNQKWIVEWQVERLAKTGNPPHRVIPARNALRASPNLKKEHILWYEDMDQILKGTTFIRGGTGKDACGCRRTWGICDAPVGCMGWSYDDKPPRWTEGREESEQRRAERLKRGISLERAMELINIAEEWGQVNIPANISGDTVTCFCCPCCCHCISPSLNYGKPYKSYGKVQVGTAPSRFLAIVDQELCNGCQTCAGRCHFSAVEMVKIPGSKKLKASILPENCMGCGLCVFKCPQNAIRFEIVRPPSHIPVGTWNDLVNQPLELPRKLEALK